MVLGEALGDVRGKLRAADVWHILEIEPGRATQEQNPRLDDAMRELGWERTKRRFDGRAGWAYVRGTETERMREIRSHEPFKRVIDKVHFAGLWRRDDAPADERLAQFGRSLDVYAAVVEGGAR